MRPPVAAPRPLCLPVILVLLLGLLLGEAQAQTQAVMRVDTNAALKALAKGQRPEVYRAGNLVPGDSGAGTFVWNAASTCTDDTFTCVAPNAGGTGRWVLSQLQLGPTTQTLAASLTGGITGQFGGYPQNFWTCNDSTIPAINLSTVCYELDLAKSGGYTITGGVHIGTVFDVKLTGNATYASAGKNESFIPSFNAASSAFNLGGTASATVGLTSAGKLYGGADISQLLAGASGWLAVVGREIDCSINGTGSADVRACLNIVDFGSTGANAQGKALDAGILLGSLGGSTGFLNGILFGSLTYNGGYGVSTTGTLIGSETGTVANLIDLSKATCSTWGMQFQNGLKSECVNPILDFYNVATLKAAIGYNIAADIVGIQNKVDNLYFLNGTTATGLLLLGEGSVMTLTKNAGVQVGAPAGGDKGANTINSGGYYAGGVLGVTCGAGLGGTSRTTGGLVTTC